MKTNIYEYKDYKKFVLDWLKSQSSSGHGMRAQLAQAIACHSTYITQVLRGDAHLSSEQAEAAARFFGLNNNETLFFILLLQSQRAGTVGLRRIVERQVEDFRKRQLELKNRITFERELNEQDKLIYYSSWHYCAVHVLISIPEFRTKNTLVESLKIPLTKVVQILDFLVRCGLAIEERGSYRVAQTNLFVGRDSPTLARHHANWRMQAIASLDDECPEDLHYTSVISLSRKDLDRVREAMLAVIEEIRSTVKASGDEILLCYALDLFPVGKR